MLYSTSDVFENTYFFTHNNNNQLEISLSSTQKINYGSHFQFFHYYSDEDE